MFVAVATLAGCGGEVALKTLYHSRSIMTEPIFKGPYVYIYHCKNKRVSLTHRRLPKLRMHSQAKRMQFVTSHESIPSFDHITYLKPDYSLDLRRA